MYGIWRECASCMLGSEALTIWLIRFPLVRSTSPAQFCFPMCGLWSKRGCFKSTKDCWTTPSHHTGQDSKNVRFMLPVFVMLLLVGGWTFVFSIICVFQKCKLYNSKYHWQPQIKKEKYQHRVCVWISNAFFAHLHHFVILLVSENLSRLVPILVKSIEAEFAVVKILH